MQLEAEIKNGVLKKKVFISGKSFEMGPLKWVMVTKSNQKIQSIILL